ncbi:MAG: hypothetical protein IJZ68_07590 [Bacteroidaceae bacterium]|nr:hypothetical protein [Bacteroidaceae bacterium]
MKDLKKALAEDIKDMIHELPLFLWTVTPWILGLCAITWLSSHIQAVMG